MEISWNSFSVNNQDSRGIRFKFEDLCRQVFVNENLAGNERFRYLHANPNNSGLEAEPIFDETNQRWIGFQAKFFDNTVDYNQIKRSAEETVKNYTGKVNHVFLFCNKPITSTAAGYQKTVSLLQKSGISIELVTDTAILDCVRQKYPYLARYYFGNHSIRQEWFENQANYMFDLLGERYSQDFNVETIYTDELSLFVHDDRAVNYLNDKKVKLLREIESLQRKTCTDSPYLSTLSESINALDDVDLFSLLDACNWYDKVTARIMSFIASLEESLATVRSSIKEINESLCSETDKEKTTKASFKLYDLRKEEERIQGLLALPEQIRLKERETYLLAESVLLVVGQPGTGKTQLLAWEADHLLEQKKACLFLAGGVFFRDNPIVDQVMQNIQLDFSFDELIDVLEAIGEKNNQIIPIFIDALNETWNKELWKIGLPMIFNKVTQAPMVKLIVSYRPEYESLLLPDVILKRKEKGEITTIVHRGFQDNSIFAVKQFLNHYSIPFTPLEYFSYEMENPLFLKLYCKTYNGDEVDLPTLYERVIEQANKNIFKACGHLFRDKGYTDDTNVLEPLVSEIAGYFVINNTRKISRSELAKLPYWDTYDLAPGALLGQLAKEHILYDMKNDDEEYFYFSYDQMNDSFCAKAILKIHPAKDDIRRYLSETVLGIVENWLGGAAEIPMFVHVCALYAEKYREECIDIIDSLSDVNDKCQIFSEYIASFKWRRSAYLPAAKLRDYIKTYPCQPDDLFSMLIANSVKAYHPLNADYLHSFLMGYALNKRDRLWTLFINQLPQNESDRLIQLIEMYNRGEKLEALSEKQTELLLTLLGWVLTSSNRWLRDYASKAMIEILKENFQLCQVILEKFKDVNDPYVIQRLYGVVFGACCKRNSGELQPLAEYVYDTIFAQDMVYPDILLRDYARSIVELFLYESSDYKGKIQCEKTRPPYHSEPLPEIEDQHYLETEYSGGMFKLVHSMRFEGMGWYGDFGRYVFQSAIRYFDVDDKKIFNWAIYYILNDLGYSEKYFGEYDRYQTSYDRSTTAKTERIGKKYQWIAMYHILALVADHRKMTDRWSWPEKEEMYFEGAWEPYVRDFDPTLNQSFMTCSEAPRFDVLETHLATGREENKSSDISSPGQQIAWLESESIFLNKLKDTIIVDGNDTQWICLTKYCDTGRENLSTEKLMIWSWLHAYFMTPEQAAAFRNTAENRLPVKSSEIASYHDIYTVFNREYPWAPSCKSVNEGAWADVSVKTGEKETTTEEIDRTGLASIERILRKYKGSSIEEESAESIIEWLENIDETNISEDDLTELDTQIEVITREYDVEKPVGKILHATTDLLWEEEYDASKERPISISVPCGLLIEKMRLKQKDADGFYYDSNGKLAAFDTDLTQKINSVVVRKDILDEFLALTGMKLVWIVDAEKEIHDGNSYISMWSNWEAVFIYEGDHVSGDVHWLSNQIPQGRD